MKLKDDVKLRGMRPEILIAVLVAYDACEANGVEVSVEPQDASLVRSYGDDWAGASDGPTTVLLDKRLTQELKNEGAARDVIRNVQNLRKDARLEIDDLLVLIDVFSD